MYRLGFCKCVVHITYVITVHHAHLGNNTHIHFLLCAYLDNKLYFLDLVCLFNVNDIHSWRTRPIGAESGI